MIYPKGFVPFLEAFNLWCDAAVEYQRRAYEAQGFDHEFDEKHYRRNEGPSDFSGDIIAGLPVYILINSDTFHRAIAAVGLHVSESTLIDDFPSFRDEFENMMEEDEVPHAIDYPIYSDFVKLRRMGEGAYLYIDPFRSVIDCDVARFIQSLLEKDFDALERFWLQSLDEKLEANPQEVFDKFMPPEAFKHNFHRSWDLGEMEFWISKGVSEHPLFEAYEGCSVIVNKVELDQFICGSYPKDSAEILATVAAETKAEREFREHLTKNPTASLTKSSAKEIFGPNIGQRAFTRVWEKVSSEYPHLRRPGRRSQQT